MPNQDTLTVQQHTPKTGSWYEAEVRSERWCQALRTTAFQCSAPATNMQSFDVTMALFIHHVVYVNDRTRCVVIDIQLDCPFNKRPFILCLKLISLFIMAIMKYRGALFLLDLFTCLNLFFPPFLWPFSSFCLAVITAAPISAPGH